MLNSSKNKKKQKRKGSTLEKSTAIILDKTILESDEEEIEPSEVVELQELKPKTSILGKTWNFVKQIFHTTAPKVMVIFLNISKYLFDFLLIISSLKKPDEIVDSEGCSGTGLNIMSEETTEESQINESESCLILSHKKLEYSMVSENNEVRVYECGWNGSEINGGKDFITFVIN
uniref:Uncharacterized protein n=1 Tax=Panagrolaimus superbus TaxID=310955 RepID=A0A914Z6X7_9BILA